MRNARLLKHSTNAQPSRFDDDVVSALEEVGILLGYLGREPDARLQSCFADTNKSDSVAKFPVKPPTTSYADFLNRISELQSSVRHSGNVSHAAELETDPLTDKAFILWARDFLSALSAPATADSIRITTGYMKFRFTGCKKGGWILLINPPLKPRSR
jgi:hypothetical protein